MNRILIYIFLVISSILLNSCGIGLGFLEGLELRALTLNAGRRAILRSGSVELTAGRLVIADEAASMSMLSRVRIVRIAGQNPRLFYAGERSAFAEIIPKKGRMRLIESGEEFILNENIFSIEANSVKVRATPSSYSGKVIHTLRQGDMVFKMGEENGWYQVRLLNGGKVQIGYINPSHLLPVIFSNSNNVEKSTLKFYKTCDSCERGHTYTKSICEICSGKGWDICDNCKGTKKFLCDNCKGRRSFICDNCKGVKKYACNICGGKGKVMYGNDIQPCYTCGQLGNIQCSSCNQTGYTPCYSCDQTGYSPCYTCGQVGTVVCYTCDGSKYMKKEHLCTKCKGVGRLYVDLYNK